MPPDPPSQAAERTATMTLNMPQRYMAALEAMAAEEGMSKTATVRAALRLYQLLKVRMRETGATEIMLRGQDGEVVRLSKGSAGVLAAELAALVAVDIAAWRAC